MPAALQHGRPKDVHAVGKAHAAPQEGPAPVAIDWAQEAERAAARAIDANEEAARKAAAFSAPKSGLAGLEAAARPKPQFK